MTLWRHRNLTIIIIRPNRSTVYIDEAYCYRQSSTACRSVCLSVSIVSPAKMAERIEMPFEGGLGWAKEPRIRWGPDPPW